MKTIRDERDTGEDDSSIVRFLKDPMKQLPLSLQNSVNKQKKYYKGYLEYQGNDYNLKTSI